jgi:hypothetical protein
MRTFGFIVMLTLLLPLWLCMLVVKLSLVIADTVLDYIDRRWLP